MIADSARRFLLLARFFCKERTHSGCVSLVFSSAQKDFSTISSAFRILHASYLLLKFIFNFFASLSLFPIIFLFFFFLSFLFFLILSFIFLFIPFPLSFSLSVFPTWFSHFSLISPLWAYFSSFILSIFLSIFFRLSHLFLLSSFSQHSVSAVLKLLGNVILLFHWSFYQTSLLQHPESVGRSSFVSSYEKSKQKANF